MVQKSRDNLFFYIVHHQNNLTILKYSTEFYSTGITEFYSTGIMTDSVEVRYQELLQLYLSAVEKSHRALADLAKEISNKIDLETMEGKRSFDSLFKVTFTELFKATFTICVF